MAYSHLEHLVAEYFRWQGCIVKADQFVGRLPTGAHAMQIDVVAYDPRDRRILHIEASLDTLSWDKRKVRIEKKFLAGRRFILAQIFPWLPARTPLDQLAIVIARSPQMQFILGQPVITVDEFLKKIRQDLLLHGPLSAHAIGEQFPLLCAIQLAICGYKTVLNPTHPTPPKRRRKSTPMKPPPIPICHICGAPALSE